MDYEGEDSNKESDEVEDAREILRKPHLSGAIANKAIEKEGLTDRIRSLEEEVATVRQQLIAAEAREALAEQRAEETTHEMSEMVGHLVRHFGM